MWGATKKRLQNTPDQALLGFQAIPEVIDRILDALIEHHLGFPIQDFSARVISGWRTLGSSTGSARYSMQAHVPVMRMISSANCLMVISLGLPILTGS